MYTFSSKLKTFSVILMIIGILGIGYGFLTAPKDIQEVEKILAAQNEHGEGHEGKHEIQDATKIDNPAKFVTRGESNAPESTINENGNPTNPVAGDSIKVDSLQQPAPAVAVAANNQMKTSETAHEQTPADAHAEHEKHLEHVLNQLQNKPWAAFYVALIFFMLISLGVLAFYAIQEVSQAGWSPVLHRVMHGITGYLPVASIIFFIFLILCGMHMNNLFPWLEKGITVPGDVHYDKLVANKSGYLNFPSWLIRAAVFLIVWNLYRFFSRKNVLAQDESDDNNHYKKNFKLSAGFLVFFIVSESIMSWDWIMSLDPHWFSTLFGWYVFSSFFVTGITMILMVTLYLKSKGYLEHVNSSHIHDLAKFIFGFSIFWTYLWFAQFMLIWYANIPEEVTYFKTRIEFYNLPFFGALVLNFVFPILILMNTDFKRIYGILVTAGVVVIFGHYVDFFNMIMPSTVGDQWYMGISEISSVLFFLGLFIMVVFTSLTKAPLLPKRNPFIEESKHFHY